MAFAEFSIQEALWSVLSGIVGGAVALLCGYYLAIQHERIRRTARWEPYGKELWSKRVELCTRMLIQERELLNLLSFRLSEVQRISSTADDESGRREAIEQQVREFTEQFTKFIEAARRLDVEIYLLLPKQVWMRHFAFQESFYEFLEGNAISLDGASHETAVEKLLERFFKLVNACRNAIGVDPLDIQVSEAWRRGEFFSNLTVTRAKLEK